MNESKPMQTGVPSADRPWMQYYPPQLIENLEIFGLNVPLLGKLLDVAQGDGAERD